MSQVAQQQVDRNVVVLRLITWFLAGVVVSAIFVVVVPPLEVLLLLASATATVAIRVRDGRFGLRSMAMLMGAVVISIYTLIWILG